MNARQRRGIVLLLVSVLCALAAFAGVWALVRNVQSRVGPQVTAYELRKDVPAYRALHGGQFTKVSMPRRWLPGTAVTDLAAVRGRVAAGKLHKGSLLQTDMVAKRPGLAPGQQEIAIMIDAETGVAGKIRPGDKVNIFATFAGERRDGGKKGTPDRAKVLVSGAKVLDVGRLTPSREGGGEIAGSGGSGVAGRGQGTGASRPRTSQRDGAGVPLTFALSTRDAQRVAYAESFAEHVRLALVAPGSGDGVSDSDRTYTLPDD